ncbi:MAG: SDR family NAD(P)-dependent oxidoreductase [Amphiplicatus sp.]
MAYEFSGKICVVTGSGSGIGRALALALARRGAVLALSDVNPETLAETVAMLGGPADKIFSERLDVTEAAAIEAYAARLRERIGPADYVFNVAGLSRIGRFRHTPLSSFEKVIEANFWGVVRMSKAFLPQLLETRGGLVNIASIFGVIAVPGQAHYCASKFAVRGFSEALMSELEEDGVRVTCVMPGGVDTNIARAAAVDWLPPDARSHEDVVRSFKKMAITSAEEAAEQILKGVSKGARFVPVGRDAKRVMLIQRLFPQSYIKIIRRLGGDVLD